MTGSDRDNGSMVAELVVMAPVLVTLMGAFVLGAQLLTDHQDVDDLARTAVEAASSSATAQQASSAAQSIVSETASGERLECADLSVSTNTASYVAGGAVSVTVTCTFLVPSLAFLHVPAEVPLSATATAVLEPYRVIGQ